MNGADLPLFKYAPPCALVLFGNCQWKQTGSLASGCWSLQTCMPEHACADRLCLPRHAEGAKAEKAYAKDGTIPDPASTDNPEFQIVLGLIRDGLKKSPNKWTKYAEALQGAWCSALCWTTC